MSLKAFCFLFILTMVRFLDVVIKMCLNLTWYCNLLPKSHATWSASNRISFQTLDHTFEIYRSYSRIPLLFCLVYLYSHPSHSRTNRTPTEMPSQKHFFFHIPLKLKLYLKIWPFLQQKEHFCLHNNRYNVYNCWIVCLISLLANFYKLFFSRFFSFCRLCCISALDSFI